MMMLYKTTMKAPKLNCLAQTAQHHERHMKTANDPFVIQYNALE